MSIFDEERKKLGLPTSSGVSSFLQSERERVLSGQKTRFQEIKDRNVDNQRSMGAYLNDPRKNERKKKKTSTKTTKSSKPKEVQGERDGLLGFLDRYVAPISKGATEMLMPGNQERMELNNPKNPVTRAAKKDRGLETDILNTIGMIGATAMPVSQGYKGANFILNKTGALGKATGLIENATVKGATKIGANSSSRLGKAIGKNADKIGQVMGELGKRTIVGGTAGGLTELGLSLENEFANSDGGNLKDYAIRTGLGAVGGAVLDPAFYGIGQGVKKGVNAGLKKLIPGELPKFNGQTPDETLQKLMPRTSDITLPTQKAPLSVNSTFNVQRYHNPKQPLNEFLGKNTKESDLFQMAKKVNYTNRNMPDFSNSKFSIGEADKDIISTHFMDVPKDLVDTAPPQYWQKRYEDFVGHVNQNYNTNNLSKEGLEDLWSQFARYDEPVTLEQVVDLAYQGYKEPKNLNANEVWNQLGNRPSVSKNAKNIMGIDDSMFLKNKGQSLAPVKPQEPPLQATIKKTVYKPTPKVEQAPKQANESAFYNTVAKQEKTSPEMLQRLQEFDKSYTPMSNEEVVKFANDYIANDIEKAYQFVKNARKFDPRHVTVGHRLIDELQARGEYDRALDVVERLAEQGTKAGQSIQAYSIYGRLTAQGQLLRAQRTVNRINENIVKPEQKVKLTEDTIKNITNAADSIQRLTGQEELTNDVINIMEKMKKGKTATDDELDMVRSFVSDAKKFVGDTTPKPERAKVKSTDPRTRDKVVDFMSKREEVARQRLNKALNRANSLPVDVFYDLSIIGASKIAKGTVKFADFTEQMVKEFGEEIRPYMRQIWDKAAETFNLQSENLTSRKLSEVEKIVNKATKDKTLLPEQAETVQKYLQDYLRYTGDAKLEASMQLQTVLQLLERPTFAQKVATTQTIAQLLNPKTVVRNAIGNELFYRVEQMNKFVATPIDIVKSKITGSQRTVTFRTNNQGKYWHNWMLGLKAGWKGVNPMGLTTAYDLGPQAFRSKWNPMTYLEKTLGATLRSFDHAGYMRAYNKTLGETATLRAVNEGLSGKAKKEAISRYVREADENMKHIADSYGKYATFQDSTVLANALTKVKRGLNKVSTLGATDEFGLGDLVLKYPKTPGNLIMRALEYSPAGLVRSGHLLRDFIKTKNPLQEREMVLSFTRAIVGTGGFSMMGYVLADKGILTSSGHSDYEVASLERNAGKQPNSVNITALQRFIGSGFNLDEAETRENDTFVSYDWAQPISMAIALGTGVNQSVKEEKEINPTKAAKTAFDSATNTIIEQSVLSGLNDFVASYPGRTLSDRVTGAVKGLPSSFVPTLSNQIKQMNDNTSRTTYSPNPLEEMKNKSFNRIPNLDSVLPPAYDTLGNQRQTFQNGSNNALNVFFNPSFVSKYKPSAEAKFVLDFINQTGDKTVAPRLAPKKLDGKELTGAQFAEMQRIMGEETREGFEKVVPKLQGETDFEKIRKALEKVLRGAGDKARKEIRKEVGE